MSEFVALKNKLSGTQFLQTKKTFGPSQDQFGAFETVKGKPRQQVWKNYGSLGHLIWGKEEKKTGKKDEKSPW